MILQQSGAPGRRDELLSQSDRSRVVRRFLPGGSVIHKQPLGSRAYLRRRHEVAILERLASVPGIAKLSDDQSAAGVISLHDDWGAQLATHLQAEKLPFAELLDLALRLADTIAAMHLLGVVHRDINPSNILLVGAERRPVLIDFDIASSFAEERPAFTTRAEIAGTLAYIAPEQTGRTGRVLDQRADLYALGATLYELATGQTPFGSDDSFAVIRDHLVRIATPPAAMDTRVPQAFSDIIMHLLEKEPDRRYQSAEGLAADLTLLIERQARGESEPFPLGEHDFPQRLLAPSRLIGREVEIGELAASFEDAVTGRGNALLIAGALGVGKTALINELRSIATANGGFFVTGKFDCYRQDTDSDAVRRAFRALLRMLLAEPEEDLVLLRARILKALGAYAVLSGAVIPELGVLLDISPGFVFDDPLRAQAQLAQSAFELLKCIATPARPIVFVVDDLQWAPSAALQFIDAVVSGAAIPGLLLVGAYRRTEINAAHPLTAMLAGWKHLNVSPRELFLTDLRPRDISELIAEMLRLEPLAAKEFARAMHLRTGGNPFDTVEYINALRRDGALTPGPAGWNWDEATIRRYGGRDDVVALLRERIDALCEGSEHVLDVMACLGGSLSHSLLRDAVDCSGAALDDWLNPALEEGLIVLEQGVEPSFRFRHDRIQQAARERLGEHERSQLRLTLARRLASLPARENIAAEQYLGAFELLRDPAECRAVIDLFRHGSVQAHVLANHVAVERFIAAATKLVPYAELQGHALEATLENEFHAALYTLGRLEEADAVFRSIAARTNEPLQLVEATCVAINGLTNRNRPREALELGLALLARVGIAVPVHSGLDSAVEDHLDSIYRWCDANADVTAPPSRELTELQVKSAADLIARMMPPAYFSDRSILAWLVLESLRLWAEFGPRATLVGALSHIGVVVTALRGDYRTAFQAVRKILTLSERYAFEPETSLARFHFSALQYYFDSFEDSVDQARAAHRGLVQGGDLQHACYTYYVSIPLLLQCSSALEQSAVEVEAGLAFSLRTGNSQAEDSYLSYRQLIKSLRGETLSVGSFTDGSFDEDTRAAALERNRIGAATFHICRALGALLFGQTAKLQRHIACAMPLLASVDGMPAYAFARILHALAAAQGVRGAPTESRLEILTELDSSLQWLQERAVDARANLLHVVRLIEAERAWALNDFKAAGTAFEAALVEARLQKSPRHHALVAERAGRFYLEHGLDRAAMSLLADARDCYDAWGATGKVRQLDLEYPGLAPPAQGARRSTTMSADSIDMIGILQASQALSSETSLRSLEARVSELLAALTGATSVRLIIRRDDTEEWLIPQDDRDGAPISSLDAVAGDLLPMTAFRYVQRTLEPLLLADATDDDRFARDSYFKGLTQCSLLVVPIFSQAQPRAIIVLENRLSRNAFSTERLDTVLLIAGQLAVSLDNALLYATLEKKVADRTEALESANHELAKLSRTDKLTGLVNRRGFDEALAGTWKKALRANAPIGLALIDIDEFKKYNDCYGHLAGDACLEKVAGALKDGLRPGSDIVARYGGEEFVLILPDTDLSGALSTAERLRARVAALNESHATASHGIVTVSVGIVAFVPAADREAASYLEEADIALYEAKRNGRNRVECADYTATV